MSHRLHIALLLAGLAIASSTSAQSTDTSQLTLDRIFVDKEFQTERSPRLRWLDEGDRYTTLETSEAFPEHRDIVRHNAADGGSRVLVAANRLIPAGHSEPLAISDYHWSQDGKRLLIFTNTRRVWRRNTRGDYWVLDVASGLARPVSPRGQAAARPKWTPDGRIAYTILHGPRFEEIVVMEPVTGAQPEPLMPEADELGTQADPEFSPDGRFMLVAYNGFDGREPGIYLFEIGKPDSLRPFFASPKIEGFPAFSPDGRWVAYHTDGSGRFEVYLRPFNPQRPESTPIHPVTTSGGSHPLWSRDGRTLYHLKSTRGDVLYAVTIETEPELKISEPRVAVEGISYAIDVLSGSERFVTIKQPRDTDERPELRIAVDWLADSQQ